MPIVRCEHCEKTIDLDTDSEVIEREGWYHWQCAMDLGDEMFKEEEDEILRGSRRNARYNKAVAEEVNNETGITAFDKEVGGDC